MFPAGWWGKFLETFGSKSFEASIEDSLQRLKRVAEKRFLLSKEMA